MDSLRQGLLDERGVGNVGSFDIGSRTKKVQFRCPPVVQISDHHDETMHAARRVWYLLMLEKGVVRVLREGYSNENTGLLLDLLLLRSGVANKTRYCTLCSIDKGHSCLLW